MRSSPTCRRSSRGNGCRGYRSCRGCVRSATNITARRILSELYRIRHRNALKLHTKYLHFFEVSACTTLSKAVTVDTLDAWILDSVGRSRNRPHIHLLPLVIVAKKNDSAQGAEPRAKDSSASRIQSRVQLAGSRNANAPCSRQGRSG